MRTIVDAYYRLLTWLLVASVAILIVPVSLQIFSRMTSLIPSYIWTEEMARFFFIWMIMIGAMVGIRDSAHFDVDLWPELAPRANALLRVVSNLFVLVFALVFLWYGIRFVQFGWNQNSELAELPMPFIFAAWPLAGLTWIVFLGEKFVADLRTVMGAVLRAHDKEGYDLSFSVAITAVSAVLAVIIPPSILMIVWGGTLTVSIGALFLAGIVPGLLLGLVQMATVHVYAKLRNYPKYPRSTLKEVGIALVVAVPALMTPVIIIGGKIFGWFTATESAAIAVLYAGVLSIFIYREMGRRQLHGALLDTGKLAAVALFCVGTASAFGWLLAYYQIPKALLAGVSSWGMGVTATGFFIAFCFLVVGCFLDAIPAIIIVGTILEPLARSVGMDPVHFAMIGIVSLAFGLVTPPYGLCLMISCAIAKVRMIHVLKDVMIMLVPMLGVLALTIVFPDIILFLPRLISPEFLK
jgi:tripartite ATP-independent transporter DctM subunit